MEKGPGQYFGTEIDQKWWRRYFGEGFFVRGNGEYWFDEKGFFFQRYLAEKPLFIPFEEVCDILIGTWHSGRWNYGLPIVKILWNHRGMLLSSGFRLSLNEGESNRLIAELKQRASNISRSAGTI